MINDSGRNSHKKFKHFFRWLPVGYAALLFSGTVLVLALVLYLAIARPLDESRYINVKQYQAVFLNNGQVYFGKIKSLHDDFVRLQGIYYLKQNTQSATDPNAQPSSTLTLTKLGCELHGPSDEMVINRTQVTCWENLKSDSQVVTKIGDFIKQNPQGQKCNKTTQSTDQSGSVNTTTPKP